MENFRRQFAREAVATLASLSNELRAAENVSDSARHAAFRALHTVKGTAQTFGYAAASRLAHELESLLSALHTRKTPDGDESKAVFLEGIELLIASLTGKNFQIPHAFREKIRRIIPDAATGNAFDDVFPDVPADFTNQLSRQEKTALRFALENGDDIFCLEIEFELANFADGLINFREAVSRTGEIIATLPGTKSSGERIGFQILLASGAEISVIETIAAENRAAIVFKTSPDFFSNDASGIAAQIVKHGETAAHALGKQIEFVVFADQTPLPTEHLKTVFGVLLHLIRNAVDHAFESSGSVEIRLKVEAGQTIITVADDGSGINLERVKAAAIEKNLISPDRILSEGETLDLIFLPEFSTKIGVTEVSGRGVGLDAVKSAVDEAGGTINVTSRGGQGTTFEIFLPLNE